MAWWVPVLIFFARICDVSIGTVRTILMTGGYKYVAATLGFFEVIIWVLAVSGAIQNLSEPFAVLAYGGGFASGVLVGMTIEERIALGFRVVRIISVKANGNLCETLRARDYRVTRVDGKGRDGPVEVAFLAVKRKDVPSLMNVIHEVAPDAFVTVERVERPHGANFGKVSTRKSAASEQVRK